MWTMNWRSEAPVAVPARCDSLLRNRRPRRQTLLPCHHMNPNSVVDRSFRPDAEDYLWQADFAEPAGSQAASAAAEIVADHFGTVQRIHRVFPSKCPPDSQCSA